MRYVLAIILICCANAPLLHAEQASTITVFGQASAVVNSDRSVWRLSVSCRDQKFDIAMAAVQQGVEQALATGQSLGLDRGQMQVGRMSVAMRYETKDGRDTRKLSHYEATQRLTFVESDLERYDEFRNALAGLSGMTVEQQFQASGADSVRDRILLAALESAKRKAEALAAVVGMKVGPALSISEFKPEATQREVDAVAYQRGAMPDLGRPEGIEIKATIYATFALEMPRD